MATKRNPGEFDCYAAASEDEPMFVLLGRDECAPERVEEWARKRLRKLFGQLASSAPPDDEEELRIIRKIAEALQCANEMRTWRANELDRERQQEESRTLRGDDIYSIFTQACTREDEGHICGVNGPCNGLPRQTDFLDEQRPIGEIARDYYNAAQVDARAAASLLEREADVARPERIARDLVGGGTLRSDGTIVEDPHPDDLPAHLVRYTPGGNAALSARARRGDKAAAAEFLARAAGVSSPFIELPCDCERKD